MLTLLSCRRPLHSCLCWPVPVSSQVSRHVQHREQKKQRGATETEAGAEAEADCSNSSRFVPCFPASVSGTALFVPAESEPPVHRHLNSPTPRLRHHSRSLCATATEGIRTPAGRAQWTSSPSPWPLGHSVDVFISKTKALTNHKTGPHKAAPPAWKISTSSIRSWRSSRSRWEQHKHKSDCKQKNKWMRKL